MEKRIEVVTRRVGDLKLDFGNPRKIKKQKKDDLQKSLKEYGDFDIIVINEKNQVIGGNQRVSIIKAENPDTEVVCKLLIGYTVAEQKYINIKLNSHAGEWDMDELGDWTADLMGNFKMDIDLKETPVDERPIKEMELKVQTDGLPEEMVSTLGIEGAKVKVAKRRINARAIWYDEMEAVIVPADEYKKMKVD